MGLLHQPELEPGPHRDLVDALHRLHHEAGRPSLRAIARRSGCSHTTVFHLFAHPRLPAWSLLEVVVTAIGGDPADFRDLWLAATADGARHLPPPARTIAGRRAELLVVRRHLEAGGGLLVVTGEPGIGTTTLLAAASQQVSTFVARAGGLPILADAPFALVSDVLRQVWLDDEGRWFGEALGRCPGFVAPALSRILPEIGLPGRDVEDRFATDRLFAAIESTLAALSSLRPLALVLEDLHWSDPQLARLRRAARRRWPGCPDRRQPAHRRVRGGRRVADARASRGGAGAQPGSAHPQGDPGAAAAARRTPVAPRRRRARPRAGPRGAVVHRGAGALDDRGHGAGAAGRPAVPAARPPQPERQVGAARRSARGPSPPPAGRRGRDVDGPARARPTPCASWCPGTCSPTPTPRPTSPSATR